MRLFSMTSGRAQARLVVAGAALTAATLIAGCGNSYKSVVTPISTTGPAAQVNSYAVVVSAASKSSGQASIIDWAGDFTIAYAAIGPGPLNFALDELGSEGYTINRDGTMTNFPIINSLQAKSVLYSTLPSSDGVKAAVVNMMAPSSGMYAADLTGNVIDVFSGSPQALKQSVPVSTTPVMVAGSPTLSGQREYAISQNFSDTTGVACNTSPTTRGNGKITPIEISTNNPDSSMDAGKCPVYAVQTSDQRRLFVLNRGDDTITVVNTVNNALDSCTAFKNAQTGNWITCHQTIPLSQKALTLPGVKPPANCDITTNPTCGLPATAGPVYAEYNSTKQQLYVANYDGGTISIIDVPTDEYGNDSNTYAIGNCTADTYTACGAITGGFGTVRTVNVGNTSTPYPASLTVLADGSRAYTANQGDDSGSGNGTVSVVNLSSYTVEKTLTVVGHPRTVVSTQNSTTAKIYASSPDSPYLTIIKDTGTSSDAIDTTILVTGNIVDVRVTTQNGSSGNSLYTTRTPGYGMPCSLPPTLLSNASLLAASSPIDTCRQIPGQ